MAGIHDVEYKYLFSNRTIFRQLLETFVPEVWVKEADFEAAETLDKSYISDHFKATESDLLYKVPLRDSEVYIYILLGFQSTVPRFMALRVLHCLTSFYMDYVKSGSRIRKLPPIFPILLYNGEKRWTAPTSLETLIERPDLLGQFRISFEYFKIAENEFSQASLFKIRDIVSALFLTEAYYDVEVLRGELLELFDHEPDKHAVSLFLNWFQQVSDQGRYREIDPEALSHVYQNREEVQSMLVNAIARDRKKIYEKGLKKGKQ